MMMAENDGQWYFPCTLMKRFRHQPHEPMTCRGLSKGLLKAFRMPLFLCWRISDRCLWIDVALAGGMWWDPLEYIQRTRTAATFSATPVENKLSVAQDSNYRKKRLQMWKFDSRLIPKPQQFTNIDMKSQVEACLYQPLIRVTQVVLNHSRCSWWSLVHQPNRCRPLWAAWISASAAWAAWHFEMGGTSLHRFSWWITWDATIATVDREPIPTCKNLGVLIFRLF